MWFRKKEQAGLLVDIFKEHSDMPPVAEAECILLKVLTEEDGDPDTNNGKSLWVEVEI